MSTIVKVLSGAFPVSDTNTATTRIHCRLKALLNILWLSKLVMRPLEPDAPASYTEFSILVVGVSRSKVAVVFFTVMLVSLFLTFHVLYDSAVYNIHVAQVHAHRQSQQQQHIYTSFNIDEEEFTSPGSQKLQQKHPHQQYLIEQYKRGHDYHYQQPYDYNAAENSLHRDDYGHNAAKTNEPSSFDHKYYLGQASVDTMTYNSPLSWWPFPSAPIQQRQNKALNDINSINNNRGFNKALDGNSAEMPPKSAHNRHLIAMTETLTTSVTAPAAATIGASTLYPSNRVHFPRTSRRLPQALIIGVRKCGTRALLEMLYLHPRIQKAGGEVHFFDRDENYLKGLEWYRKKMPHSFRGQITIEKSPSYFVSPEVPERVRAMNASIKLLLIVREPVTRAISDYTQLRSHAATGTSSSPTMAESLIFSSTTVTGSNDPHPYQQHQQPQFNQLLSPKIVLGKHLPLSLQQQTAVQENSIDNSNVNNYNDNVVDVGDVGDVGVKLNPINVNSNNNYLTFSTMTNINLSNSSLAVTTTPTSSKSFEELAIFPNGTVNDSYRPLTISMYHLHLHRWLEVFPREQLLVVNGDRLIDDPVSQLQRIETFLGIEHRISTNHFYFNETKGFYCLRYESGDRCLRETKGRKHPYVDPIVISKLRKYFAEHNQRFYELIGEDLSWPEV